MTKESYLGAREATTITSSRPQSLSQPPWSVSQYHTLKCLLVSPTSLNISQKKCKECSAGREDRGDDRPGTNMPRRSWSRLSMSALIPKAATPSEPSMSRSRSASRKRSVRGRSQTCRILRQSCRYKLKGPCTRSLCEYWHPPERQFHKTEWDAKQGTSVCSRTTRFAKVLSQL